MHCSETIVSGKSQCRELPPPVLLQPVKTRILLSFFASLALGGLASAQTFNLFCDSVAPTDAVSYTYANMSAPGGMATTDNGYLGVIGFHASGGPEVYMFCTDLSQNVVLGGGPYALTATSLANAPVTDSTGVMGAAKAGKLSALYGMVFGGSDVSGYNPTSLSAYQMVGAGTLGDFEQGFQMAVSALVYGDGLSVSNPGSGFYVTAGDSTAVAQANAWLADLATYAGASMPLIALTSPEAQDQIIPSDTLTAIPEPSAYACIIGLGAIAGAVIRRLRIVRAVVA